jgi:DNA helicase-2/ATP-dependent DNA helicase PcrA
MATKKAKKPVETPIYDRLTDAQKSVVDHGSGPLLAGAVAGAGKSTTLIERVAKLVVQGTPIQRICLVAFNVAAANDLNKKLKKRLKGIDTGEGDVEVARTLHSLALAVFKSDTASSSTRLDHTGSLWPKAIQAAFEQMGLTKEERDVELVKKFTSKVRNDYLPCDPLLMRLGHVPDELLKAASIVISSRKSPRITDPKALVEVFLAANAIRQTGNVQGADGIPFITFDDVLWEAVRSLERDESLLKRWQARYDHIIVDEAQDLCESQWLLAEYLSSGHTNLVVVGDPAQALYRFRGARPERLTGFASRWAQAKMVYMQENFRSGSAILDGANEVLEQLPPEQKLPMRLASTRGMTGTVGLMSPRDSASEASEIAAACHAIKAQGGEWRDIAILVRTNDQTVDLELQAFRQKVPVRLVSGTSFFSVHETQVILAYLRLILGKADADDLLLCVTNPGRYLGRKFVEEVTARAGGGTGDWVEKVAASRCGGPRGAEFCEHMRSWRASMRRGATPMTLIDSILDQTDYARWHLREKAEQDTASDLATNLSRVRAFASDFDTVEKLVETVDAMQAAQKSAAASRNAVTISTVHQAKGLEWPVVFIPGLTESRWPLPWSELEDELRCFYVAVTRARDECWLSHYEDGSGATSKTKHTSFVNAMKPFASGAKPTDARQMVAPGQLLLL